jgi:tRNA 2-thiouridine synthesizing protein C
MVKNVLLIIKSPPYGSGRAAEGLRMATAMIAMDMLPRILFIDDGLYCLVRNQNPSSVGLQSFEERLKTIADLIGLLGVSDSMDQQGLSQSDFEKLNIKCLSLSEAAMLISQNETTITF